MSLWLSLYVANSTDGPIVFLGRFRTRSECAEIPPPVLGCRERTRQCRLESSEPRYLLFARKRQPHMRNPL